MNGINTNLENLQKLAALLDKVPKDKQEFVAAHLIGTVQGVLISSSVEKKTA